MLRQNRTILTEKLKESLSSVLPVTGIVFLLCFTISPVPNGLLMGFVLGAFMLILGMGLFTLGTDMAMTPIGTHVGSAVTRSRRVWLIVLVSLLVGVFITISEPDLQVLAEQVPGVPNMTLIIAVAAGVGVFLVLAMLRMLFRIRLSYLLIGLYLFVFLLAQFVPQEFLSVAFDSGGVTTGPMTVPFIMALGVGVAAIRSDSNAENDSFGLVALCSVGPIIAVLVLGILYSAGTGEYVPVAIPEIENSKELWELFLSSFPKYIEEVALALCPILLFFLLFQAVSLRLKRGELIKIGVGLAYTYAGLVLFLTGVNVGFMPVGNYIGELIGGMEHNWIIIPIGMVIGYFIVAAEPAVHVLNRQVLTITAGAIPQKALSTSLSIGVCLSVGLAMLRIITGLPILYLLVPGYLIAGILTFFCPPLFTAIAFDSGGVASGPMTATFLLPLAMGACSGAGGNVVADAFGVVAMVAMTPLITIQVLGVYYKHKSQGSVSEEESGPAALKDDEIITFE
ncbi:MAG: DUF1538 domain-containing protein [Oscillospiraceae bacterium]|nr:DUF1538 domain-containing protein [Oscillospiraceae bacterium]